MKNKEKLVSIILNCYNGEKYLKYALRSILSQSYKNWELIFWDNRSTDSSKKIFNTFKNKKFRYFLSSSHTSLYEARNLAINKCKGQFLSFLDVDDMWEENKLESQVKLFEDKKVGVVYGNSWLLNETTKKKRKFINYNMKNGYIYNDLIQRYNVGILTAIIRKSCLKNLKKIFDKKYNIIGDYDLFIRLSKKFKFKVIQDPVATYRIHANNLSILKKDLEIKELNHWLKINKKSLGLLNCKKIKKKIKNLEFLNLKFKKNFIHASIYFLKFIFQIGNIRNLLILMLPKFFLKKIMWFY